ncbi:MAG: DUF1801 domain-containing protein [Calditrichae bacterium]|nr:DUF1801 domain-containing protein [Calditrichota bacterium]MCB9057970.1 DUF1801 domain-containing protein [Calditrichia bacterium]
MGELKTKPNNASVEDFLKAVSDPQKQKDSFTILKMMQEISGHKPEMWGSSIVGFGKYHYKYESGREGNWFLTGFSPRKQALTIYVMAGFKKYDSYLKNLGKFKTGAGCLYVKKLADINTDILKEIIKDSIATVSKKYK